jgi:uncharacterized membrane protein YdfJ with MMPL/SSD domain
MGYGGMLVPLVSTLVAITLLPVVLAKLGPRLDWPHRRSDDKASRAWTRWASAVARRRWVAASAGMAVVLALAAAATGLQLGTADADTIARSGDARQGLVALERAGIAEGSLLPHEILVGRGADPQRVAAAVRDVAHLRALRRRARPGGGGDYALTMKRGPGRAPQRLPPIDRLDHATLSTLPGRGGKEPPATEAGKGGRPPVAVVRGPDHRRQEEGA